MQFTGKEIYEITLFFNDFGAYFVYQGDWQAVVANSGVDSVAYIDTSTLNTDTVLLGSKPNIKPFVGAMTLVADSVISFKRVKEVFLVLLLVTQNVFSSDIENIESWLPSFCTERVHVIQDAVSECVEELSSEYNVRSETDFCIYSLGSYSSDIALPQSDFEFGILANRDVDRRFFDAFLPLLREKLNACGIRFDNHQTFPQFYEEGKPLGMPILCSSPDELIDVMRRNTASFCYLLYFTKYIYGNRALYQTFIDDRSTLQRSIKVAFLREIRKTIKKDHNIVNLYHLLEGHNESVEMADVVFKKHLFRPLIDFINYLSFLHGIPFTSPFSELKELAQKGVVLPQEEEQIRNALLFAIEKRLDNNDQACPLKSLSTQELYALRQHWDTVFFLTRKTRDAAAKVVL